MNRSFLLGAGLLCMAALSIFPHHFAASQAVFYDSTFYQKQEWGENPFVRFNSNGSFESQLLYQGIVWSFRGTYEVSAGKVHLTIKDSTGITEPAPKECHSLNDESDLFYSMHLHCSPGNWKYPNRSMPVAPGTRRKVHGIPVIVTGQTLGVTTTNVKLRERPDISSKAITCYIRCSDAVISKAKEKDCTTDKTEYPVRPVGHVPVGTEVKIIARTVEKAGIGSWNNYWYYVEASPSIELIHTGWMFGEFVKKK